MFLLFENRSLFFHFVHIFEPNKIKFGSMQANYRTFCPCFDINNRIWMLYVGQAKSFVWQFVKKLFSPSFHDSLDRIRRSASDEKCFSFDWHCEKFYHQLKNNNDSKQQPIQKFKLKSLRKMPFEWPSTREGWLVYRIEGIEMDWYTTTSLWQLSSVQL